MKSIIGPKAQIVLHDRDNKERRQNSQFQRLPLFKTLREPDGSRTYWMCRRRPVCKKRAITSTPTGLFKGQFSQRQNKVWSTQLILRLLLSADSSVVEVFKSMDHDHPPAPEEGQAIRAYSRMKRAAKQHPEAPPAQILRQHMPDVPVEALPYLPERQTMKRTMNRLRQGDFPSNPKSLAELGEIPEAFRKTSSGKNFLLYDSYDDDDDDDEDDEEAEARRRESRILVFCAKSDLKRLARADTWQLDGTFDTAPTIFAQILTIHGTVDGEILPLLYALLPDKTQASYTRVLSVVVQKCAEFRIRRPAPRLVILDFEKGLINATKQAFPDAETKLCLFHLRQSGYRKIQELGLQVAYRNEENPEVRDCFREIVGCAFVPTADVVPSFQAAKNHAPNAMRPFCSYFGEYYVTGRRAQRGRRAVPPRYPPGEWNQYEAALNNEPKTNNAKEGWHNRFQTMVGKSHPSLYPLILEFKKEQADTSVMIAELNVGKQVKQPQRQMFRRINQRLQRLAEQYNHFKEEGRLLEYLRACGHTAGL
ncbi:PKS-NRPS hybrid synthetase [Frankliniella fusca]|uniref:PKS-NRPS hybrid synthetase n=1 Tax=Frankliniella fusca TaxID=407009 RepID=A0AAE1HYT1_9NEOP|nr:PKS-NRPS hybrid synthetase [Frankliniella fusca]